MERPSYFAIIPAEVRYDKSLPPGAKLMYGELTALASTDRGCFAKNSYFADLYGVSERTIRQWFVSLEECGYIERQSDKWTGEGRKILIRNNPRPTYEIESYDDIFANCGIYGELKHWYIEFIKHCQVNGRIITNDKLYRLIVGLDYWTDDQHKINSLRAAIDKGYFTVQEVIDTLTPRKPNK